MPKININGVTREMTAEEVAEMERWAAEHPAPEKSLEEQLNEAKTEIEELKTAYSELGDAMIEIASLVSSDET